MEIVDAPANIRSKNSKHGNLKDILAKVAQLKPGKALKLGPFTNSKECHPIRQRIYAEAPGKYAASYKDGHLFVYIKQ